MSVRRLALHRADQCILMRTCIDVETRTALSVDDERCAHTLVCITIMCMAQVDRFSVTMPPEIGAAVRDAASRQGTSVSNWLAAAASQRLRNELLGAALDVWEAEDGPFSDEELDAAAAALGVARRRGAA
jgi:hypothetical protein